jgi:uncharacterized protein (DUF2336 family)
MLEGAPQLSEDDLLHVARTQGQDHLRAISQRPVVPSLVSDAIVQRGDDTTLGVLLRNEGAVLSREAHEAAVDRAAANPALHEAVIDRQACRWTCSTRCTSWPRRACATGSWSATPHVDPAILEAALKAGRKRVAAQRRRPAGRLRRPANSPPSSPEGAGAITPQSLVGMLRANKTSQFLVALADLADIDFHTARKIIERRELDALSWSARRPTSTAPCS